MTDGVQKTFGTRGHQSAPSILMNNQKDVISRDDDGEFEHEQTADNNASILRYLFGYKGRAGRLEFWVVTLLYGAIFWVLKDSIKIDQNATVVIDGLSLLYMLLALVVGSFIYTAISVRRYHDLGKSGWRYLTMVIPIIGPIWCLFELGCLPGDRGANRYGPRT